MEAILAAANKTKDQLMAALTGEAVVLKSLKLRKKVVKKLLPNNNERLNLEV